MRGMSDYQIPMSARIFAGVFAAGITTICAVMAAVSAMERAPDLLGAAMFAAMAVAMVVGSHVLPGLARRNWIAQAAFLVCVGVTLYNHAFFFDSRAKSMSVQRQTQVAPSAAVARYEQELARITARDLPVVAADMAQAGTGLAKAQAALERCQSKDGVRCTSAAATVAIAQSKLDALHDERSQAVRAEDLRKQLATAVEEHDNAVRAAGISTVDATLATWIGVKTETVATGMAFLQSVVLEVMGALLWAVALPRQRRVERKPKVQEVRVKHLVPYRPQAQRAVQQIGWVQKVLAHSQARSRDSPALA